MQYDVGDGPRSEGVKAPRRLPFTGFTGFTGLAGLSYVGRRTWTADDELDVRWYVWDAPGLAAGIRSNFAVQLEALRLGLTHVESTCTDPEDAMIARLEHSNRAERVGAVLRAMTAADRDVLLAAFGCDPVPPDARVRFGQELAAVALLVAPALRPVFGLRGRSKGHDVEIAKARAAAEKALVGAKAAYVGCRS